MGVDVSAEMADLVQYAKTHHPSLLVDFEKRAAESKPSAAELVMQGLRTVGGNLGGRSIKRRLHAFQLSQKLQNGTQHTRFWASGDDFGFRDILGCAEFLGGYVKRMSRESSKIDSKTAASETRPLGTTASAP